MTNAANDTRNTAHRIWAKGLCEKWNWNADVAEIAHELIDLRVHPDSVRFEVLRDVFNDFFNHPKMDCIEAVEKVLETFGDFDLGGDE